MEYYHIILDHDILDEFIEWLPDLRKDNQDNELFYMALFARKKYCKDIISSPSDKIQLQRALVKKNTIKKELLKWECKLDTYKLKKDIVPQQALACYITPNPRSSKKAMYSLMKDLVDFASKGNIPHNLHQNAISAVQKSKSYTYRVDFDLDTKENIDFDKLFEIVPKKAVNILETRGGYHILVNPKHELLKNPEYPKNWYQKIKEIYPVDISGDGLIPIPGCTQGNFIPKFVDL